MENVTLILSTPEALLFKNFQEFHKTFALLVEKGVFDIKNGSAVIHFDQAGYVQKIERHDSLYNARVDKRTEGVL